MRAVSVTMNVSLDGVVQGLGRPDEDTRGGFTHGGWGTWHQDEALGQEMGKGMSRPADMLFGRRTWQDFSAAWGSSEDGNPFTEHLNAVTKYVVSRSLPDAAGWQNSVLLRGDAEQTVTQLKETDGPDLAIVGSAALVRDLHATGLIDHYTLVIHPVTLGVGRRMFEGPAPLTRFALTSSITTPRGVIVAHYDRC
jgi:dihydrofolate reductase